MKNRLLILIAVLALTTGSVPLEVLTWADAHAAGEVCCATQSDHEPADCCADTDDDSLPHCDDSSCPPGCDGCFLPCCTGLMCLGAAAVSLDVDRATVAAPFFSGDDYARTDPQSIFHPPQS